MILLLGGTGTYFLDLEATLGAGSYQTLETPYGTAGSIYQPAQFGGKIGLASRHGWGRLDVSPPFVNSRANIWAAKELGYQQILSWNGVGAINQLLQVHDLVVLNYVLNGTKTRPINFAGDRPSPTAWQIPQPVFDVASAQALYQQARKQQPRSFDCGTYACSEGPRLETAAEIRAWANFGADVVGMTLVPEVLLAYELGIKFASLAYVTNYATGVEPSAGAPRFFGVEVAQTCLQIVLATAEHLLATSDVSNS
ncbi:MTAP family purine nucleoside phosphorylase [Herpetosiphon llansteffanensis]